MRHYSGAEFKKLLIDSGQEEGVTFWWINPVFIENAISDTEESIYDYGAQNVEVKAMPAVMVDTDEIGDTVITSSDGQLTRTVAILPDVSPTYAMLAEIHAAGEAPWGYEYMTILSISEAIREYVFKPEKLPAFKLDDVMTH